MEKEDRRFITINDTPHYPITFPSYDHLLNMAEKDRDTKHPFGEVYISKGTHEDNKVRIVLLKGNEPMQGLSGFVFDRKLWLHDKNPFNPYYHSPHAAIQRHMGRLKSRLRSAGRHLNLF